MRATNLSKDIVPSISLPFPSEKNDVKIIDNITFYLLGEFTLVDSTWQKSKCKLLQLTFVSEIIFENQFFEKRADLRQLVPSKELRFSPDGNCLFR